MDNYTLESFINYCDEMQIAEESARELKKYNKIFKKKMDLLKIKIERNDSNYEEQIKLIDEMVEIIEDYKSAAKNIKITKADTVIGKIREILAGVTAVISFIAACTIVGIPIAIPGFCLTGTLGINADPFKYKADMLSDLDKAKDYLLSIKKYIKKESIATEAIGSIRSEKRKLKRDLADSGYGNTGSRFKKDARSASRYLDGKLKDFIAKEYKHEIDLIKKISAEVDKEFVYIAHKYKDTLGSINVLKNEDEDYEYQIYIESFPENNNMADKLYRKEIISFVKELTEASNNIKQKYKSSLGKYIKILINDIDDDDYEFMFEIRLVNTGL